MKKDLSTQLPSLSDQDIVTMARTRFSSIVRSGKNVTVSLALATTSSMLMTSCADDKSCSDGDITTTSATDFGQFQDPYDPQVLSYSDPGGSGDRCSDSD